MAYVRPPLSKALSVCAPRERCICVGRGTQNARPRAGTCAMHSAAHSGAPPAAPGGPPRTKPKDTTGIAPVCRFRSYGELEAALLAADAALGPRDHGTLDLIVLRPATNERRVVAEVPASAAQGVAGSGWTETPVKRRTDQVCVMSTAAIRAIASDDPQYWPPAGDQLFLDFDMSESNINPGDRVRIGQVELEMTTKPHNGCAKFVARYGMDALKVVNSPEGKRRRLRGMYFTVVKDGVLRTGDKVEKIW